ncbi:hypothetical protein SAMN04324258_3341 [Krasilnikoviella flava]|uniref:Uncharacterized protein n=1 Tax=Krasilnikoviella flava TaxID=526729 RepID=A0A1T5LFY5_9MICO|nr:hypothetical protein SAMN04324258_3341 [Krasilnikoviella flava]
MVTVRYLASTRCEVCGQRIAAAMVHVVGGQGGPPDHMTIANVGWHLECRGHDGALEEFVEQCPECEARA